MHIPLHTRDDRCYAAFHLDRILMVNALGEYARLYEHAPEFHQRTLLQQQYEFVNTLLRSSDDTTTHELRITASPDHEHPQRGRVDVHCLIALPAQAACAATRVDALFRLLNAQYTDLVWLPAADVAALLELPDAQYAVSISRTAGYITATGHSQRTGFALAPHAEHTTAQQRTPMFVVHPFVHSETPHHALFGFLLQHDTPVTLSIRLQKTTLTAAETRFLQENLATFDDTQPFPQSVAEQLHNTQRIMHSLLQRSHDCAALLAIDLLSATPIPAHVVALVGNLLTQPVGGWYKSSDSAGHPIHYHGGYTVTTHADARDVSAAVRRVSVTAPLAAADLLTERLPHLVDASEAAMVFRFPRSSLLPLPGITMQANRVLNTPHELPDHGTRIGAAVRNGRSADIHISDVDRTRHTYLIGQTGTGKSTVLKQMMLDDITRGRGICLIDPHGDLVEDMLALIPPERRDDVILIDPTQTDFPIGINVFEYTTQAEREIANQLFQKTIELIEHARGTPDMYMGPVFWQHLRNNAYWITQNPDDPGTIIDLYNMYAFPDYHERWYPIDEHDAKLVSWKKTMENTEYHKIGSDGFSSFSYFSSKFEDFVFDTRIRLIFGQQKSSFDFYEAMNTRKIILINLSRGVLSEIASTFLGGVLLAKIQQAALKRAEIPHEQREFYGIYVDEFQNYTSESFISLLSESRKYGISLTLANQFLAQIKNRAIVSAVLGNVGTIVSFRVGIEDAEFLKARFAPEVSTNDLMNLPNWHAYVATQVNGQTVRPFSMHTIPPLESRDETARDAVKTTSMLRYGTPRPLVDEMSARGMQGKNPPAAAVPPPADTDDTPLFRTSNRYTIERSAIPFVHEYIVHQKPPQRTPIVHGHGLSIWSMKGGNTAVRIGMAPSARQVLEEYPLERCVPFAAGWGDGAAAFKRWHKQHPITTMAELERLVNVQHHTGEMEPHVRTYAEALLAYAAHDHPAASPWRDIAVARDLAVVLDHTGTAWVWNALSNAVRHEIRNALAIAAAETSCYVLHGDQTVWQYTPTHAHQVGDVPAIHVLVSGERRVLALDTAGVSYIIDGHTAEPCVTPSDAPLRLVAAGDRHSIGVNTDGVVVMWGNTWRHDNIPAELRNGTVAIAALAAGNRRSYALDATGRLYIWGEDSLSPAALHAANVLGVQQMYAIDKELWYQTKDGRWWHNGDPLGPVEGIDPSTIERLFVSDRSQWIVACRATQPQLLARQWQIALRAVSGLDERTALAWQDLGVTTVYDYLQRNPAENTALPFFAAYPDQLDLFELAIALHVETQGITQYNPAKPLTIAALLKTSNGSAAYFDVIGPHVTDTTAKKKNDDDFDFDLDALFADL